VGDRHAKRFQLRPLSNDSIEMIEKDIWIKLIQILKWAFSIPYILRVRFQGYELCPAGGFWGYQGIKGVLILSIDTLSIRYVVEIILNIENSRMGVKV